MTNYEFHKQEIEEFLLEHGNTSFAVVNNEVVNCGGTSCSEGEEGDTPVGVIIGGVKKNDK